MIDHEQANNDLATSTMDLLSNPEMICEELK